MKFFIPAIAALLIPAFSSASDLISVENNSAGNFVQISFPQGEFGRRVADALVQSPQVKEIARNPWVKPGTVFEGKSFRLTLDKEKGTASLNFTIPTADQTALVVQGNFLRLTGNKGTVKAFHEALLLSRSEYALTRGRSNGRISPIEGQATVLEGEHFGGKSISCTPSFDRKDVSFCDFNLSK